MGLFSGRKSEMVTEDTALPGRETPIIQPGLHAVLGTSMAPPFPEGFEQAIVALGCFWGAERIFWQQPGVYTTAVGYAGGFTPNPTYEEVCSGRTGHAEAVLVVFDPALTSYEHLLTVFFEGHDPTQGMRQGNDWGTQYRSAIYTTSPAQEKAAPRCEARFQGALSASGSARSRPRSRRPAPSSTPRSTTSSTWRRTPTGTAASAAPASRARSGWPRSSRSERAGPSFFERPWRRRAIRAKIGTEI